MENPKPEDILKIDSTKDVPTGDVTAEPSKIISTDAEQPSYEKLLEEHQAAEAKKVGTSVGWMIFWLVAFTPVGWYYVVRKTSWPNWVKLTVIAVTAFIFIALLWETQSIANQVAGSAGLGY